MLKNDLIQENDCSSKIIQKYHIRNKVYVVKILN